MSEKDKHRLARAVNYEITENENGDDAKNLSKVLAFLSHDDGTDDKPQSDD